MKQICIVKVLDYEAQKNIKNKKVLECKKCPIKENCAKWVKDNEQRRKVDS